MPRPVRPGRAAPAHDSSAIVGLARQVRGWTDSVLGIAGVAADVSLGVARSMLPRAGQRRAVARAGALLRRLRETAGLSIEELGRATNLDDPALLELVEEGKIALPFEIILRLAAVLGRNDPISFVMRMTRASSPEVWQTLEGLGIGRLVLQAGREREFANIYRASDAARRLSDEEFGRVLEFTRAAFDLAMAFRASAADRGALPGSGGHTIRRPGAGGRRPAVEDKPPTAPRRRGGRAAGGA